MKIIQIATNIGLKLELAKCNPNNEYNAYFKIGGVEKQ